MGSEEKSPVEKSSPCSRQRVLRACERCRLKKSRCDGASPCGRCRTYNQTCVYRSHQKPNNKVYPKGYVEMLELEQTMLVAGLQELYRRCVSGEGWTGQSVQSLPNGMPLVHDILNCLGTLKQEVKGSSTKMETDLDSFLQTILSTNAVSYDYKVLPDANWQSMQPRNDSLPLSDCTTISQDSMICSQDQETFDTYVTMSSIDVTYPQPNVDFYALEQSQMPLTQPQDGVVHQLSWQFDGIDLSNYMDLAVEGQVSTCLPPYPDNTTECAPLAPTYWAH